ncbi:hypothetical protein ALNOE001_01480 [Candidatus Methanobinarius endosymbioticus]|uniref:Uncharacterized protein n=1 Tax=Candidatus Methanobinarius endosymbioticus TaxID=2006182 RepID=A0A366MF99_9EURY|nr:hypothetical protein ALNOE001_01480 [Candidatus Methanobinarius endosymbioticus]
MPRLMDLFKIFQNQYHSYIFMRGMVDTYNINILDKNETIALKLYFTDLNQIYQLIMTENNCILKTKNFLKYTTRLECGYEIWESVPQYDLDGV